MHCHTAQSMIISEIYEEMYVVTHPKEDLTISCRSGRTSKINAKLLNQGAVKIHLSCSCQLHTSNDVIIPQRFPCSSASLAVDAKATHIIPAAWSNLKSFILNPRMNNLSPTYRDLKECLNTNWTLHIPYVNLTSTETNYNNIMESLREPIIASYSDTYGTHSETIFLIWNITLSILVAFLIFGRNRIAVATPLFQAVHSKPIMSNVTHDAIFGTVCLCFIIFILYLTIRFCYLIWKPKIFKRRKNRRTEDDEGGEEEGIEMANISEGNVKVKYSFKTHDNKNLLHLSPGERLSGDVECIEIK